jgi:hypothetical protein
LLVAGVGGSAALCGCQARVSRLLSGVVRLRRLIMNQSTPSRSIPLPLWVTVGFYPFYLVIFLAEYISTWESKIVFRHLTFLLFWVGLFAIAVVGLLTGKPDGRRFAIGVGGVGVPVLGVSLLVVFAIVGGQADDPPAWLVVLVCLVFVLGGIWHWWALTRPAVRQWFASSQAKAIPAEGGSQSSGEKADIVN